MSEPILVLRELRKRHGPVEALRGVSLEVHPGECFGLLGPNGAGKSTLLGLLAGLAEPTSGEIVLAGRPWRRELGQRHRIGLATQELALYRDLNARENLRFFGSLYGLRGEALHAAIQRGIELAGLQDKAFMPVRTYSGGMQRRLNLAVAVVHSPQLLLLDEPTTGVDPQSRNHIFDRVRELNAAGMTILYTSHYMEEVQALCNRIAILDAGQVVACDTLPRLLQRIDGTLTLRFTSDPARLAGELQSTDGVRVRPTDARTLQLSTADVHGTLARLIPRLSALGLEMESIAMQEPNLERVFLHLTQKTLRD